MRADLHTHSSCSDGTLSPTELLLAAARSKINILGLTDHDTSSGWEEARSAAAVTGVKLICGIEISTRWENCSAHLLAYEPDSQHPQLREALEDSRRQREQRGLAMGELLQVDFPQLRGPLQWLRERCHGGKALGRPHLADALVAAGLAGDRYEAFDRYLQPGSPYYLRLHALPLVVAVALVRAAGGVPVLAHPGRGNQQLLRREKLLPLLEAGLWGLETFHRDNSPAQQKRCRALGGSLGLHLTGGSDFHGSGKVNQLGENLTPTETVSALLEQCHRSC